MPSRPSREGGDRRTPLAPHSRLDGILPFSAGLRLRLNAGAAIAAHHDARFGNPYCVSCSRAIISLLTADFQPRRSSSSSATVSPPTLRVGCGPPARNAISENDAWLPAVLRTATSTTLVRLRRAVASMW